MGKSHPEDNQRDTEQFEMNTRDRIIEGCIGGFIVILGLRNRDLALVILGAEFILDSTLLKGEGVGMVKWGFSKNSDE